MDVPAQSPALVGENADPLSDYLYLWPPGALKFPGTMPVLHNRVSKEELKRRLMEETEPRTTVSFYQYFPIENPQSFRDQLYLRLNALRVLGRIYVASEGINAQVSVPTDLWEAFREEIYGFHPRLEGIRLNRALEDDGKSFWVLKVKVRPRIVADGIEDPDFSLENRGEYLDARRFNEMTEDPDTIVVDMRNHYEYEVGHFENALEVPADTFRDQLPMAVDMLKEHKDRKIIMYCTGGIRCEKASAYFKHKGFRNVFHVEGGIIEYVRRAREENLPLKFKGKNFVFDHRLGERVTEEVIASCHICGKPCDEHTNCLNPGCHLLFIQCPQCAQELEGCCSPDCMEEKNLPESLQKARWEGRKNDTKVFNKSRHHPLRRHRREWNILSATWRSRKEKKEAQDQETEGKA